MKKALLAVIVLALFVVPVYATPIIHIEGPEGDLGPGGGEFVVNIYLENLSGFSAIQVLPQFMDGLVNNPGFQLKQGGVGAPSGFGGNWIVVDSAFTDIMKVFGAEGYGFVEYYDDPLEQYNGWDITGKTLLMSATYTYGSGLIGTYSLDFDSDWFELGYMDGDDFMPLYYNDVTVMGGTVTVVPEPATLALLGLGFASLVAARRKRARK